MSIRPYNLIAAALLILTLSGCSTTKTDKFAQDTQAMPTDTSNKRYIENVTLGWTVVNKNANGENAPTIKQKEFKSILAESLKTHKLLSKYQNPNYKLSADLQIITKIKAEKGYKIETQIYYKLRDLTTDAIVWTGYITKTANTSEVKALFEGKRLKLTLKNSIKSSIDSLAVDLIKNETEKATLKPLKNSKEV